jgi:hypothetical protein
MPTPLSNILKEINIEKSKWQIYLSSSSANKDSKKHQGITIFYSKFWEKKNRNWANKTMIPWVSSKNCTLSFLKNVEKKGKIIQQMIFDFIFNTVKTNINFFRIP